MKDPKEDREMQWTGMRRGCRNSRIRKGRQRREMFGGGGLKRPRPKVGCSAIEKE
jgi:IS5 family transposase